MKHINSNYLYALTTVLMACSGAVPAEKVEHSNDANIDTYVAQLPAWEEPPEEENLETPLAPVTRTLLDETQKPAKSMRFTCAVTQHDVTSNFDEILNLASATSPLKPGILLQGSAFQKGILSTLPIARSPVTLSIDLPVSEASIQVKNPSSATLQDAVSALQARAGTIEGNLPAMLSYSLSEVESVTELSLSIGAHGSFDGAVASASFDAAFKNQTSRRQHTVVAKLIQPMFTISFADDELPSAKDFFAPHVTANDFAQQEAAGNIGPDNLPVFIASVTYGRMVVYTATSNTASSALEITAALDASIGKYKAGGNVSEKQLETLQSLEIKVFSLGGNSSDVTGAIVSGDYGQIFSNPDSSTAVPLKYVVKNLSGSRPVAKLGDVRQFVTEECAPVTADWQMVPGPDGTDSVDFIDVAANDNDKAFALSADRVFRYDGTKFVTDRAFSELGNDKFTDIAVDDKGWAYAITNKYTLWKRDPENGNWVSGTKEYFAIDATGDGKVAGLGLDSQPYIVDRDVWTSYTKKATNGTFSSISMASEKVIWGLSGNRNSTTNRVAYQASLTDGTYAPRDATTPLFSLSAASESEVWALKDADHSIVKWDGSSSWKSVLEIPVPSAVPNQIEATTGKKLWIVTAGNQIYRFKPE